MRSRPLTTAETASALGTSQQTARRWAANGHLDAEKVGRDWMISAESVAARGLAGKFAELARVEAEIDRLEGFIASHPGSAEPAKRMLGWEIDHRERVLNFLRACGVRLPGTGMVAGEIPAQAHRVAHETPAPGSGPDSAGKP
jgi:excisionase family DNA binding protein